MALIQFTRNHQDHSTDHGFQFEFFCDRCGNGFRTHFEPSAAGAVNSALDVASNLLGGFLHRVSYAAGTVRSAGWQKAWDVAFERAVQEAMPHFNKCKRCGHWVDEDCWNKERGLCKDCAPDMQEELSSIQVEAAIHDAREKAFNVDFVKEEQFKETIVGTCPHCGAQSGGGKFCSSCGKPLVSEKFCGGCGAKLKADAKFCPSCGAKQ